jgi:hypothetical protein
MRTTLPGSVGFAYLSDRVVDSYLSDMTTTIDPNWQSRRPCPRRLAVETAALCVVFLKGGLGSIPFDDNSLIGCDIYRSCGVLLATP